METRVIFSSIDFAISKKHQHPPNPTFLIKFELSYVDIKTDVTLYANFSTVVP